LAGDDKYGDFTFNRDLHRAGLKRMFLHAARLRLPHPTSGVDLDLTAPLAAELSGFLARLDVNEKRDYGQTLPTDCL
jgi:23S rRNA pseudouridine955/2504/2580 synthase